MLLLRRGVKERLKVTRKENFAHGRSVERRGRSVHRINWTEKGKEEKRKGKKKKEYHYW